MTREEYAAYLASPEWDQKRLAVGERSHLRCERCSHGYYEDTHHLTYERVGHEDLADLQALCRACHQWIHGLEPFDPCLASAAEYKHWYVHTMPTNLAIRLMTWEDLGIDI